MADDKKPENKPAPASPELTPAKLAEAIDALVSESAAKDRPMTGPQALFELHNSLPKPYEVAAHGVAFYVNAGHASTEGAQVLADATPQRLAELVFELARAKRLEVPAVLAHLGRKWPHKVKRAAE